MIPEERYKRILEKLEQDGVVKANELSESFNTSYETIRRDLQYLERQGKLRRSAGGAAPIPAQNNDVTHYTDFLARVTQNLQDKENIAEYALRYIKEGDSVALDSGTTAFALARLIKNRFKALTVVTNSLAIAYELSDAPGITLIMTGGIYRPDEMSFISDIASQIFTRLSINIFFLTTCGLSIDKGATYQRMDEMSAQLEMLKCADRTIAIADHSKIGVNSIFKMCDISAIDTIITDSRTSDEQMAPFISAGSRIIRAD